MIRLAVVLGVLFCAARPAAAQREVEPLPDRWYALDGGAVAGIWLPLAIGLVVDLYAEPRLTPLVFDPDEGGAESRIEGETPGWALTTGAVSLGLVIAGVGDRSRWFHLKGFAQSLAVTGLATKVLKNVVGRHRPDRDPAMDRDDSHRSFPSGHASRGAASLMYTGLYLHEHVLGGQVHVAWEAALYAAMAAVEVAVCAERVRNNRHHATDTIAGALLGAGVATTFFAWQERRFRRARAELELGDGVYVRVSGSF